MRYSHLVSKLTNCAQTQEKQEAQAGQSIVIMVFGIIALLAFAGLVFDGGTAYAQFRRMQSAADAGALAGAQEVAKKADTTDRNVCEIVLKYAHDLNGSPIIGRQSEAYVQVQYILKDNSTVLMPHCTTVQLPGNPGVPNGPPPANVAGVRATVRSEIPTFFLGIFGLKAGMVTAHSSAEFKPASAMTAAPLAKRCEEGHGPEDKCGLKPGEVSDIWESSLPGNFGWLAWNGDNRSGQIALELDPNFILDGSDPAHTYIDDMPTACTVLYAGCWVQGSPGVNNSKDIRDKLQWYIDHNRPLIVVIYDKEEEGGSNSEFHVIGFAAFDLVSYNLPGKTITGSFKDVWFAATPPCETCADTGFYTVHLIPDIVSPEPTAPEKAKICAAVMNDLDHDAAVDVEDYYVTGANVTISGASGTIASWVSAGLSTNCVEVMPGGYSVTEVNPTSPIALSQSSTPNSASFTLVEGELKDVIFLDYAPFVGRINAFVFDDGTDGNGTQDGGDGPFANAAITVRVNDPGQSLVGSGTTSITGTVIFARPPGNYLVYASPPAGYRLTTASPLGASIVASSTVFVTFGMQYVPNGDICVQVLEDLNNNGVKDAGEPLIGNASLSVRNNATGQVYSMPSSTSGPYCWRDLEVGSYTVTESNVGGYQSLDSDLFVGTVTDNGQWDVTFRDWIPPVGELCALVYDDTNGNGEWSPGELPAKQAVVNVIDWNNVVVGQWKTDDSGFHCIGNLSADPTKSYRVMETNPPLYASTTSDLQTVTVIKNSRVDVLFGDRMTNATATPTRTRTATPTVTNTPPPGATLTPTPTPTMTPIPGDLCVTVFEDLNKNGLWDTTPPAPPPAPTPTVAFTPEILLAPKDVTVFNSIGDPLVSWDGTGAQPYCFRNLYPGQYSTVETNAPGYGSTTADSVSGLVTSGSSLMVPFGDILCLATTPQMIDPPEYQPATGKFLLAWENVYADFYRVYGSSTSIDPNQTAEWHLVGTVSAINYSVVQGTDGSHFYVVSVNNCGTSSPSNVVTLPLVP